MLTQILRPRIFNKSAGWVATTRGLEGRNLERFGMFYLVIQCTLRCDRHGHQIAAGASRGAVLAAAVVVVVVGGLVVVVVVILRPVVVVVDAKLRMALQQAGVRVMALLHSGTFVSTCIVRHDK